LLWGIVLSVPPVSSLTRPKKETTVTPYSPSPSLKLASKSKSLPLWKGGWANTGWVYWMFNEFYQNNHPTTGSWLDEDGRWRRRHSASWI